MITIETIEELDQKIAECHQAAAISDGELRRVLGSFRMAPIGVNLDPFSDEYLRTQMDLYERISGRVYTVKNEAYPVDVTSLEEIFPYSTRSPRIIGGQYAAIGALLTRLEAAPPARIIEFGAGWGNTSIALAQSGYDLTVVDTEESFCRLIQRRAAELDLSIRAINADFMSTETMDETFDIAIFFECFHHCADHPRLLRALHRILKPGGRIYFLGEPITRQFPMPWGLRLDGESLWAIRHHGWLELGFHPSYFREILRRTGWTVRLHLGPSITCHLWEARDADLGLWRPTLAERLRGAFSRTP